MTPVQRSRLVQAPASVIFDLLATPARHTEIDGSGTVRGVSDRRTPDRLSPGARFGMQMHWGARYKILNEVVEFDEPHLIAWRHFAGHVWRYRLEPVDAHTTRVTEEFDDRGARSRLALRILNAYARNGRSIEQTLDRLAARFAGPA